jgi:hypothetical protein
MQYAESCAILGIRAPYADGIVEPDVAVASPIASQMLCGN